MLNGFKDFKRVAIGIGRPTSRDSKVVGNYVLSDFSSEEMEILKNQVFVQIEIWRDET